MPEIVIEQHPGFNTIYSGYRGNEFLFRIEYHGPGQGGQPVVNQGWRLLEVRWHKTRFGRPVQNKNPRYALISVHDTLDDAKNAATERYSN